MIYAFRTMLFADTQETLHQFITRVCKILINKQYRYKSYQINLNKLIDQQIEYILHNTK